MRDSLRSISKYLNYIYSYCVKEKRVTDCIPGTEKFVQAKNGRLMMKCKCSSCGITKTRFVKNKN